MRTSGPDSATAVALGASFHPMPPTRVLDSRGTTGGWAGPLTAATPVELAVARTDAVPAAATAVVLNVTVTNPDAASFLTVWPAGTAEPGASNVNFGPGETVANNVVARVGTDGGVLFATANGSTDVVADVVGYYDDGTTDGDLYTPLPPTRILDSRGPTGGWNAALGAGDGSVQTLTVRGTAEVPTTATSVVMNLTVTEGDQGSFIEAWPTGTSRPNASSVNFGPGQTIANLTTVALGADGSVSFYNAHGSVHIVADLVGFYDPTSGSRFHALDTPVRMLDDRDGTGYVYGPWSAAETRGIYVAGAQSPDLLRATAIVANLTATNPTAGSFVTMAPAGPVPEASNLNFGPGETIANLTVTANQPNPDPMISTISLFNARGTVDLIADVAAYFAPL